MDPIKKNDTGAPVLDVQNRLVRAGFLPEEKVTGTFDDDTVAAIKKLCERLDIEPREVVDDVVWSKLVDESFELGNRNLYLRVPFFHGRDVRTLQEALSALGFSCGAIDGMFGAHTEDAVRRFQLNMGLPSDGIVGAFTFRALINLHHSWKDKDSFSSVPHVGFARAAEVLDTNLICLFGMTQFTRSVAARMSNLALATSPASKVTSADSLLVSPEEDMLFIQILVGDEEPATTIPVVEFGDETTLASRLSQAIQAAEHKNRRVAVRLPVEDWQDAGKARSAQHYAIVLLDALCGALLLLQQH
ncbi:MAG: peptidoglycan-binding protein [Eggerthellaceae bacterium]